MNKSRREPLGEVVDEHWVSSGRSAVTLCHIMLSRIADVNEHLGALTEVLYASAVEEASVVDAKAAQGLSAGHLAGWPIAVKDNIDTVPARCSAGLSFFKDRRPKTDAEVVTRLRQAGATIVGVAYTDNGAFGVTSPGVVNPNYPDRIAGGSSGGSAAAVAAGLCFAALGTDTGGSIRIPAACCGIFGFKPTKNRVSTVGVRPLATSFDHVGVLSDSVARIREVCAVIDPRFNDSPNSSAKFPATLVVGIPSNFYADAHEEVLQHMSRTVSLLKDMGVTVKEVSVEPPDGVVQSHLVLSLTEAALEHVDFYGDAALDSYPDIAKQGILLGQSYSAAEHLVAIRHSSAFISQIDEVLNTVDFLMLPTLPVSPPKRDSTSVTLQGRALSVLNALIRYTAIFDQSGHPVIALPLFDDTGSVPGSIQLVGKMHGDQQLLIFAEKFTASLANCELTL